MSTPTASMGDQLYTGAAEVGKIRTTIGLVFAVIIGIILLIAGISLLLKKNVHTMKVSATVDSGTCPPIYTNTKNGSYINFKCDLKISYVHDGERYPKLDATPGSEPTFFPLSITSTQAYVKGNTVDVYIDPNNPVDYSLESLQSDKLAGWIFIGIAVFIVGMSYLMRWLSQRYKFFAAAEGVGLATNIVTDGFRGGNYYGGNYYGGNMF